MHRPLVARSHALVSLLATSACIMPAPLGGNDTGTGTGTDDGTTDGPGATSDPTAGDETGVDTGPAPAGPAKIDILFVMDNSGSMGEEQASLAASIDGLVGGLEGIEGISYRIGVTTTDVVSNPWCGSTSPEDGGLVASSCLGRTGQFVFNGNPPADVTDVACTDICDLQALPITPTLVAGELLPRERPWIEGGNGVTNLDGVGVGDALRCMLPQGVAGCGFEQPLEAVSRAIERSQIPGDPNFGFLRADAHLAIILVTDETDCSNDSDYQSIFLPPDMGGNQEFWTDPDASAPTSGVCWNAGVVCEGEGSPYESCRAANLSVDGDVDVLDGEAVLVPPQTYVDQLTAVLAQKRAVSDASVFLYGVMGVPAGYPANPLVFADAVDPTRQIDFGIGPGCEGEACSATPPVRQLAVIESFAYDNLVGPQVFSICDPDLGGVYGQLVAQLAPYLGG
jgi:hypothetical protein